MRGSDILSEMAHDGKEETRHKYAVKCANLSALLGDNRTPGEFITAWKQYAREQGQGIEAAIIADDYDKLAYTVNRRRDDGTLPALPVVRGV